MKKVCILTSREIGKKCIEWAKENLPSGFVLVNQPEESDIVISVLYENLLTSHILQKAQCYNFHPGILPEYRGAGAFSWGLINKSKKSGITLHLIDEGIDTGDIIEIREFIISPQDTAYTLYNKGQALIYKMFTNWFEDLLNNNYTATAQPEERAATYYRKDLNKAKNISHIIRAFHFPDKESAYYINNKGKKIYINFEE